MMNLFIALFVSLALATTGCAKRGEPPPPAQETKQAEPAKAEGAEEDEKLGKVEHKVTSFNLEGYNDQGVKEWEILGESAKSTEANLIEITNIKANSFGDESKATLQADSGVYDRSKNNVRLKDNIKLTIDNAGSLTNEYVDLGPGSGGKDKESKTVITCDGEVEFDYTGNKIYFKDNVRVDHDEGEIKADKITVTLEPKTKKLKEIVADGNVSIIRGENVTYSEKATYVDADKRVVLSGRPKIVIYQKEDIIKEGL